tara:strand:+ start:74 stop:700 length:627 start_codon:yes stop_codon:yes gene_type:complete
VNKLILSVLSVICSGVFGSTYTVNREDSIIGVVIRKEGPLSAAAHNHFIFADDYQVLSSFDPDAAEGSVSFNHQDLVNDVHAVTMRYSSDLRSRGIVDEEFKELSEDDRNTIRGHMLADDQLGKGDITVKFLGFTGKNASIELTVKDVSVTKEVEAVFEENGDSASLAVTGPFLFSDFGIKPYSAFGGLLRNKDEFYIYGRFNLNVRD